MKVTISPEQLRQLGDIRRDPPRLVFGEVRNPSLLLRLPTLRFVAKSDLLQLANDFSRLS
jgi:hypothetical protein